MLKLPLSGDPQLTELVHVLRSELYRKEIAVFGLHRDANTYLRFRVPIGIQWAGIHVQGEGPGEGGSAFNPAEYISSTVRDCREDRLQDVTIPGAARRFVWLIPIEKDAIGEVIRYDGQDGRPDNMSVVDTGGAGVDESGDFIWLGRHTFAAPAVTVQGLNEMVPFSSGGSHPAMLHLHSATAELGSGADILFSSRFWGSSTVAAASIGTVREVGETNTSLYARTSLVFRTSNYPDINTERMRLDSGGRLTVGTAAPGSATAGGVRAIGYSQFDAGVEAGRSLFYGLESAPGDGQWWSGDDSYQGGGKQHYFDVYGPQGGDGSAYTAGAHHGANATNRGGRVGGRFRGGDGLDYAGGGAGVHATGGDRSGPGIGDQGGAGIFAIGGIGSIEGPDQRAPAGYFRGFAVVEESVRVGGSALPSRPHPAAVLELNSSDRGLLLPRLTTAERDAIAGAPDGLIVYNTTTHRFQGRAAGAWVDL